MRGSSGAGGGMPAETRAQIDKLNELLRIANEEGEQARQERDAAQESIEATYAEGRAWIQLARQEKKDLEQQREAEREIVVTAMTQLKSLQIQAGEKDAVIQKALTKMKELNAACAVATRGQQDAEASSRSLTESSEAMATRVRSLENQLAKAGASLAMIADSAGAGGSAQAAASAALQQLQAATLAPAPAPPPQDVMATIPDNAEPGTTFEITLPSGEAAVATVPEGAMAGDDMVVTATITAPPPVVLPPIPAAAGGAVPASPDGGGGSEGALAGMMARIDAQQAELESTLQSLDAQRTAKQQMETDLAASQAKLDQIERENSDKVEKMMDQMKRMHADTEGTSKRMEEKDAAIKVAQDQMAGEKAVHEEVSQQQQKVIESLQLAMQAKDEKAGAQRNVVKTLESNTAAAGMRGSLGAVPAQDAPPIAVAIPGGGGGPAEPEPESVGGGRRSAGGYKDFDSVTKKESGKKSGGWFSRSSAAADTVPTTSWAQTLGSVTGKIKAAVGMAEDEEEEQKPQPMPPLPYSLTCVRMEKDGTTQPVKRYTGAETKMQLPPSNAEVEAECGTMVEYLDRMHSNLECLSTSYEVYLDAVRAVDTAVEGLGPAVFAFAGVSPPAKLFFRIIAQSTASHKEQLEMAQAVLESTLKSFWTSEEALTMKNGALKSMMTRASTEYNVAMAHALANTRPDKYESSLEGPGGAKCAAAKHNVQRWNYIASLERLAQERELETNRLFTRFLDAQCEIAEVNKAQHEMLLPEIEKAQEEIKASSSLMKRFSKAQQQYETRLALKIDRVQLNGAAEQLPGVTFTGSTAEGLVFMRPK